MILSTYLDAVYNSGGVPGLPGSIDDEIDPRNMVVLSIRATRGHFSSNFPYKLGRHGSPRAQNLGIPSHRPQEAFTHPPGLPG